MPHILWVIVLLIYVYIYTVCAGRPVETPGSVRGVSGNGYPYRDILSTVEAAWNITLSPWARRKLPGFIWSGPGSRR
ncbi:hypothetical protein DMP75_06265 [Klebsiella michiganensis]|nr:hypothetical protein DMP75_06265 [Klebsiella michiganensis]